MIILSPSRMTHDGRTTPTFFAVKLVALAGGIGPEIDVALEALQLGIHIAPFFPTALRIVPDILMLEVEHVKPFRRMLGRVWLGGWGRGALTLFEHC